MNATLDLERSWVLVPPRVPVSDDVFMRSAGYARRLLPEDLYNRLVDFAEDSLGGSLLLKGLNFGAVPPTPHSPTDNTDKDTLSEFTLLTIARVLGEPVGYLPEHGGEIVQNIVPVLGREDAQISTSSRHELMFHTEAAFHPHRPRYLLLACLRGDPTAATTMASVEDITSCLSSKDIHILRSSLFRTAVDESYVGSRRPDLLGPPVPVLWGPSSSQRLTFDADLMIGITTDATATLQRLSDVISEVRTSVILQAGDLLIIDNSKIVHGRSPFIPRFDGTDRWLQRAFVVSDLLPSLKERSGRVITTTWST